MNSPASNSPDSLEIGYDLARELRNQTIATARAHEGFVRASGMRDHQKLLTEQIVAQRSEEIRAAFAGEKGLTEARLTLLLQDDAKALEARAALHDAQAAVTDAEGKVACWRMRASMLRDLVSLAVAGGGGIVEQEPQRPSMAKPPRPLLKR
jgi:hypothetical protein